MLFERAQQFSEGHVASSSQHTIMSVRMCCTVHTASERYQEWDSRTCYVIIFSSVLYFYYFFFRSHWRGGCFFGEGALLGLLSHCCTFTFTLSIAVRQCLRNTLRYHFVQPKLWVNGDCFTGKHEACFTQLQCRRFVGYFSWMIVENVLENYITNGCMSFNVYPSKPM